MSSPAGDRIVSGGRSFNGSCPRHHIHCGVRAGKGKAMLNILGRRSTFCDGVSRRNFLKIGAFGFGMGALTLPQILRAEALAGIKSSHKALIMIYLPGGPSHQDMYDIKTDAPSEIRGEFKPID